MRRAAPVALSPRQRAPADAGLKMMIPVAGRPFLDHLLGMLRAAGVQEVCLVVGPDARELEAYAARGFPGLRLESAVQERPRGTADAVVAAAAFVASRPVLLANGDNLVPVAALAAVAALPGAGLGVFPRAALLDGRSNLDAERIAAFAIVRRDLRGRLVEIAEKPSPATLARWPGSPRVSFNTWRLTPEIVEACRDVAPSPRGELELPSAVALAMARDGVEVAVVECDGPVLDLSRREDVAAVEERLASGVAGLGAGVDPRGPWRC